MYMIYRYMYHLYAMYDKIIRMCDQILDFFLFRDRNYSFTN